MTASTNTAGGANFWDFQKLPAWLAACFLGGLGLLVSKSVLANVDQIVRYINSIAWNSVEAVPPIAALALLFACIRSEVIRTAVSNYFKVGAIALAKIMIRSNPVGWLNARLLDFSELIGDIEKVVQEFKGMIGILTQELKDNRSKIGQVMERNESAGEKNAEIESLFKEVDVDFNPDEFDVERLDQYEELLSARNASSMAATQAVSLDDRNREIGELIKDLLKIWKFMVEMLADARLVKEKLVIDIRNVKLRWETSRSVWKLIRAAHKFKGSAIQQMMDEYAKEYVNESYSQALAQFKHFRSQGSELLQQASLDRRTASRKAREMLDLYRRAKLAKAIPGTPDMLVKSGTAGTIRQAVTPLRAQK